MAEQPPFAQTLLSIDDIDKLARGLAALATAKRTARSPLADLNAHECSRLVWNANNSMPAELGPLATHLAELRMQLER